MALLQKKRLFLTGTILLLVYFIYEGLNNLYYSEQNALLIDRKISNFEAHLQNNFPSIAIPIRQYLPLQYTKSPQDAAPLSKLLVIVYGLAMLGFSGFFILFDDKKQRSYYAQWLILLQLLDAFFVHWPFFEDREMDMYS